MKTRPCRATFVLALAVVAGATPLAGPDKDETDLSALLDRLGRTAVHHRETARKFACVETITWSGHNVRAGRYRFGYVYVYTEADGYIDFRTFVRARKSSGVVREVLPTEFGVPRYLKSAYTWVFAFLDSRRPYHRYEIVGRETVLGSEAVVLRFEPIPPYEFKVNDWFGTAWVDPQTAQLLKVEAYKPDEHQIKRAMEAQLAGGALLEWDYHDIERITTEFSVVKRGLRFPGRVEIVRSRYRPYQSSTGRKVKEREMLRVEQTYRDYKFFGVQAKDDITDTP